MASPTPLFTAEDSCKHEGQRALFETDPKGPSWDSVYIVCLLCGKREHL